MRAFISSPSTPHRPSSPDAKDRLVGSHASLEENAVIMATKIFVNLPVADLARSTDPKTAVPAG
jgi:hypothetical protein